MKKTLLAGMAFALIATAAACGKKETPSTPAGAAPAASSHEGTAPGSPASAPPAEAIAGKAAPADAIHGSAAGKSADPHAGLPKTDLAPGTGRKGKVAETMNAAGYTYIRVDEKGKSVWLAVMQTPVKVGDTVEFPDVPPMTNFPSKSLNRTFDAILFVPAVRVGK